MPPTTSSTVTPSLADLLAEVNPADAWRDLFEHNPATILLLDPDSGRIIAATDSAVRFYGYERSELLATRISEINTLPPAETLRTLEDAMAPGGHRYRVPHRIASGEIRMVEVYSSPITLAGRLMVQAIIHDVSSLVQAEADRDLLAAAVDQAAETVVITDSPGSSSPSTRRSRRGTAASPEQVLGRDLRGIDLILSDVIMPVMSGPGMIKRLDTTLPVTFVSGYAGDHLPAGTDAGGRHPVLSKPYSRQGLLRVVRETLDAARSAGCAGRPAGRVPAVSCVASPPH